MGWLDLSIYLGVKGVFVLGVSTWLVLRPEGGLATEDRQQVAEALPALGRALLLEAVRDHFGVAGLTGLLMLVLAVWGTPPAQAGAAACFVAHDAWSGWLDVRGPFQTVRIAVGLRAFWMVWGLVAIGAWWLG